jgi:chromosome segregation ATPase
MAATQEAQDEVDALNAQAETQAEELSLLRAEKQQLQKKINVAVQERGQMDHASKALAADNVSLHKAAEQLATKIEKCNAERYVMFRCSHSWLEI